MNAKVRLVFYRIKIATERVPADIEIIVCLQRERYSTENFI